LREGGREITDIYQCLRINIRERRGPSHTSRQHRKGGREGGREGGGKNKQEGLDEGGVKEEEGRERFYVGPRAALEDEEATDDVRVLPVQLLLLPGEGSLPPALPHALGHGLPPPLSLQPVDPHSVVEEGPGPGKALPV